LTRALAVEPELLLLDEPFGALDPTTRETLRRDFHRVIKETGVTTVFVTHDREDAYVLADRVGVLKQGRVLQLGARADVFHRPTSDAVAEFVGVENRLPGVVATSDGKRMEIAIGAVRLCANGRFLPGAAVVACIRAHDVGLDGTGYDSEMTNRLKGRITEVSLGMDRQRVSLDCGGFQLVALIDRRALPDFDLRTGAECQAVVNAAAVHAIADDGDFSSRPAGGI
jgi:molybdopterin-binding protein